MILHLVRHPPVAKAWQRRCYGQSDPGLSREGQKMAARLIKPLIALAPDIIIHSNMIRTRTLAENLAREGGATCTADPLWRERDFGIWEGQTWHAVYRATGNAMEGMVNDPTHFRPGGGETTDELIARTKRALDHVPSLPCVMVIAHGGPIACARLLCEGGKTADLPLLIPHVGTVISLRLI